MRDGSTYRGARRNQVLRVDKGVWGPQHYYGKAPNYIGHRTTLSRRPSRYHPLAGAGAFLRSLGKAWVGGRRPHAA